MSAKMRKPRPAIPNWAWLDLDNCWFCKHRNGCSGCKVMKSYSAAQKKKQDRKEKKKFDF